MRPPVQRSSSARVRSRTERLEPVTGVERAVAVDITERRAWAPWGLAGGGDGAVGENWLLRGGDGARAERLADKCTVRLAAGDVLRVLTPGGGGWGASGPG